MRARLAHTTRAIGVLVCAAMLASACGGEAAVTPPADGSTVPAGVPGATTPGATVGASSTTGAIDPATGLPMATTPSSATSTPTVPELVGGDISGGMCGGCAGFGDDGNVFTSRLPKTDEDAVDTGDGTTGPGTATVGPTPTAPAPTTTTPAAPAVKLSGAVVSIDGVTHQVSLRQSFPKGAPVFRLVGVTSSSIEVELIAGEFTSNGGTGVFLDKGDVVSLVNSTEQVTYKVKYVRPITADSGIGLGS